MSEEVLNAKNGYWKNSTFDIKRYFLVKDRDFITGNFTVITFQDNEFHYDWEFKFTVQSEANGDDENMDVDENHLNKLCRIEICLKEKLMVGHAAYVRIKVNENNLDFEFAPETTCFEEKSTNLSFKECDKLCMHIKININCEYNIDPILSNYEKLLDDQRLCTVKFDFGNTIIPAHRSLLSECYSEFKAMLMNENKKEVEITNVDPITFKHLLSFIYTGKFKTNGIEDWLKILIAANKYSMQSLVAKCETIMPYKLTPDNVVGVLLVALDVKSTSLKKKNVLSLYTATDIKWSRRKRLKLLFRKNISI